MLVEFSAAASALKSSIDLQKAVAKRNAEVEPYERFQLRVEVGRQYTLARFVRQWFDLRHFLTDEPVDLGVEQQREYQQRCQQYQVGSPAVFQVAEPVTSVIQDQ